jgi:hypothetical protein
MGVSDGQLQYYVSCRREQDTCAARLTPDAVIDTPGLGPDEIAGLKLFVVDHQLAVKQMQLFDTCMAMGRVVRSWGEPHKHRNAARLRIDGNQFAK